MFKNISHLASYHNFPAGSRQAARGARICETSLLFGQSWDYYSSLRSNWTGSRKVAWIGNGQLWFKKGLMIFVPRLSQGILGTNPISLAAPATGQDSFVLDMATSAVAYGKVRDINVES